MSLAVVCCVPGGLAAVIYTDAAQTAIMLAGSLTLMGFSKSKLTARDTHPSPALYAPVYLILLSPLLRLRGGRRLECSDGGVRKRHPFDPSAKLNLWHPSR